MSWRSTTAEASRASRLHPLIALRPHFRLVNTSSLGNVYDFAEGLVRMALGSRVDLLETVAKAPPGSNPRQNHPRTRCGWARHGPGTTPHLGAFHGVPLAKVPHTHSLSNQPASSLFDEPFRSHSVGTSSLSSQSCRRRHTGHVTMLHRPQKCERRILRLSALAI